MQSIYLEGYKGIRYNVKSAEDDFEIYDLGKDPQEAHNLAGEPEFAGLQAVMKARVLQVRKPDASAKRPYDEALVPPVAKAPAGASGVGWSLFKGEWPWMPDFRTLAPADTGQAKQIELTMASGDDPFGVAFEGCFKVPADGDYTFTVDSDGGATLFVHDIRVIDEPMKHPGGRFSGSARLEAGWHPLRLYYRHLTGVPRLGFTLRDAEGKSLKLDEASLRQVAAADSGK
jgi:PA14 domain/N-sulphoglucosamine sulphohydrolase, C-terminal